MLVCRYARSIIQLSAWLSLQAINAAWLQVKHSSVFCLASLQRSSVQSSSDALIRRESCSQGELLTNRSVRCTQTDRQTTEAQHASRSDAGCRLGTSGFDRGRPKGLARHAVPALHAEDHAQPAAARRDAGHGLILAPAGVLRHDARRREDPCGVHRWGTVRASEQIKLSRRVSTMHAIDATPARWRGVVVYYRSFQPTWPRTRLTS